MQRSSANPPVRRRNGNVTLDSAGLIVTRQPIVGSEQSEAERILDTLLGGAPQDGSAPLDLSRSGGRRYGSRQGVRYFLAESEGDGYWDFYRASDLLMISVTDAVYATERWLRVQGDAFFKVRILLAGELRNEYGNVLARGPQGLLYVSPKASREGYAVAPGQPLRMVVLHGRPELITTRLGLDPQALPAPIDVLFGADPRPRRLRIGLSPDLVRASNRIVESRNVVPAQLRGPHLESLALQIVTELLIDLDAQQNAKRVPAGLSTREYNRITEARDYLGQHYAKPPGIPALARLVGINQTKLKAGFAQVTGTTIYGYILRCRMERAAELLTSDDYSIAEVAYAVGYDYPANFTHAFKRYFGQQPRAWRRGAQSDAGCNVSE